MTSRRSRQIPAKKGDARPPKAVAEAPVTDAQSYLALVADLKQRIADTLAYVNAADPAKFAGAEERALMVTIAGREREMKGLDYFQNSALPNFYFHLTTAYGILRKNGIPVGKRDFLGNND